MRKETLDRIQAIDASIKVLTAEKKQLETELLSSLDNQIKEQIGAKDYGCGTANVSGDGYKVKVMVNKKVTWDPDLLAEVFDKIQDSGDDPFEYIQRKLTVSETAYKNWPSMIQKIFEPARTVEPAKPRITIEEEAA